MGSGPGGQHRNKTMSAVKVTHIKTGLSAYVDGRCQHSNKKDAMSMVISRLKAKAIGDHNGNENKDRLSQIGNMGRGTRIRTYNFIEDRVKDERVSKKFRTKDIMNGKLDLVYENV